MHAHERPFANAFFTGQGQMDLAGAICVLRRTVGNRVVSTIPHHDRPRAVIAGGNDALEFAVRDRMVLHFDGEHAFPRLHRHALRHCPGPQDAVHFETEIVVQPRGVMFLNHITTNHRRLPGFGRSAAGLSAGRKVTLGVVAPQPVRRGFRRWAPGRPRSHAAIDRPQRGRSPAGRPCEMLETSGCCLGPPGVAATPPAP